VKSKIFKHIRIKIHCRKKSTVRSGEIFDRSIMNFALINHRVDYRSSIFYPIADFFEKKQHFAPKIFSIDLRTINSIEYSNPGIYQLKSINYNYIDKNR